jgi:hypothetical protein
MADLLPYYPKGRIALGNGDLYDVENVKITIKNGAKLKHTLRRSPSGVVKGVLESELNFEGIVSEAGYERDYIGKILNGTVTQLRIKVPGETITFTGVPTERSQELPLDDAIKFTVNWIGAVSVS